MNRPHDRSHRRRQRYLRQHGRITDKYQLYAWWLRGIADQVACSFRPHLHPDLYDEYDNGGYPPGAGAPATATSRSTICTR
jgi:hypothetical protein